MAYTLNTAGMAQARALISAKKVSADAWSFSADDSKSLLDTDDWAAYGAMHLGIDATKPLRTKGHYVYPFGKAGTLYPSALRTIRSRTAPETKGIFAAAGKLLDSLTKAIPARPDDYQETRPQDMTVNPAAVAYADEMMNVGSYDPVQPWDFNAMDATGLLGEDGRDWENYSRNHLGISQDAAGIAMTPGGGKAASEGGPKPSDFAYPFAKNGTVHRAGLDKAKADATKNGHHDVASHAASMMSKMDEMEAAKKGKSVKTKAIGDMMPEDGEDRPTWMDRCQASGEDADMCASMWDESGMKSGKSTGLVSRAYSFLNVKSVVEDQRMIRGIATSPAVDRIGDIIEPLGVRYANPSPLLHQHRADAPVGIVTFDKPTDKGMAFQAVFPRIKDPGPLRDRVETAWGEVKAGLVRAVSIGFRSLQHEVMKSGGLRYKAIECLELSLVTVPANAEATISLVKSIDAQSLAASGRARTTTKTTRLPPPGVTGSEKPVIKALEGIMARKPIAEQIASYEATRIAKTARMDDIMDAATERGETLDAEEKEEYGGLDIEVKAVDEHLVLLRAREKRMVAEAKVVDKAAGTDADRMLNGGGGDNRVADRVRVQVRSPQLPPGTAFTRYVMATARAKGNLMQAAEYAKAWKDSTPEVEMVLRVAVAGGNSDDSAWAAPLVYYQNMAAEFIEYLRPLTIMGRIAGLRRVPFNIKVPRQTASSSVNWVGEMAPKPVSALAFDQVTLGHAKISGIVPLSDELLRFSSPAVEQIVRNDLANSVAQFMDLSFVDPSRAAVTNVSPASITNGLTPTNASGTSAAALRLDIQTVLDTFLAANLSPVGGVWIMTQQQALAISLMLNALGQPVFPNITMEGGSLVGFPVIASENIPGAGGSPTDGSIIIFAKAGEILVADDGGVNIDVSNEASLQMDTTPDSPAVNTTVLVSLWQQNMTAIRCEREVNWVKRRSTAAAYINYARYSN